VRRGVRDSTNRPTRVGTGGSSPIRLFSPINQFSLAYMTNMCYTILMNNRLFNNIDGRLMLLLVVLAYVCLM